MTEQQRQAALTWLRQSERLARMSGLGRWGYQGRHTGRPAEAMSALRLEVAGLEQGGRHRAA